MRTQTFQMLTRLNTWNYFSNHTTKQNPPVANSLETIHDNMHLLIGGNEQVEGHMSEVPVAGEHLPGGSSKVDLTDHWSGRL